MRCLPVGLLVAGLSCRSGPTKAPKPRAPAVATASPAKLTLPFQYQDADGCFPYWREIELGCQDADIRSEAAVRDGTPVKVCDPVHERAARTALVITRHPPQLDSPLMGEYLRGVAWNDDPEGLLFADQVEATYLFSPKLDWCERFQAAQAKALKGYLPGPADPLTGRSHFGDLQFLHGLASKPGEPAVETYGKTIRWLEFTYRVAHGDISGETLLSAVPVEGLAALFPRQASASVSALFGVNEWGDVRARAMGSFMHVLQDLAGSGHVARQSRDGGLSAAIDHYFTSSGVEHLHYRSDEGWRNGWKVSGSLDNIPALHDAIDRNVDILSMEARHEPWSNVKTYLDSHVFHYAALQAPAVAWSSERKPAFINRGNGTAVP